ncbi:MAG: hypothetical protein HOB84_15465 [Candidatus Marinimicrobia bacterium]|jgi:uncharacterized paraquat-inducible protein A|nr:hypothetical protein [Candidatus Neomarinimicrobiota bacterium]MBT4362257.1 hypothetical protein [Candidatus Neomarinimicrobiota bacterium]MBT4716168.1 hypothetical protein [Candidatus Neomarinimicrobiota bacterium]MBT4947644.1 hypothetical protein [Candidatus Neomarinimicrobiota bacterium]MBT5271195.1 hypothetical protein [Candidatus Neomarinimicrobiota bacterium]
MKSFRGERQRKNASVQVILTVLVLLTFMLLVNLVPIDVKGGNSQTQKTTWESSVVKLP